MRVIPLLLSLLLVGADHPLGTGGQQGFFPHTITLTGEVTIADYERLLEREFEVPSGTRRIEVEYSNTGADRRTVIDLGLRGPAGLRGWSGGGKRQIAVSALAASQSYLPGPIEPGRWAVLLGVPNIRDASRDRYTLTIRLFDTDFAPPRLVVRPEPGWYAGDLHVHSGHSDGRAKSVRGADIGTPAHRVFDAALAAGLDFVLLSDHNTASHWLDVERLQPHYDSLLLLHGREVTTYRGHANTVGETRFDDFRLSRPSESPASVLAAIAATGAFVSINHPTRPDDETCMGCGWNVADAEVMRHVQGIEVVNGVEPISPVSGWQYWAGLLNAGYRVTAVGGSDEHSIDQPADRNIGTPTTVVYARELSETAIVEGLKSGRVYIRTQNPSGPHVELSAVVSGVVYQMGRVIAAGAPVSMELIATLKGANGQTLEWLRRGAVFSAEPATDGPHRQRLEATTGDWFALVVRDASNAPTLITNAISLAGRAAPQ